MKSSIKQINAFSDIEIEAHFEKKGNVVIAIWFGIQRNPNHTDTNSETLEREYTESRLSRIKTMTELGLHKNQISHILDKFDDDYIDKKLFWVQEQLSKDDGVRNPAAFAYKATMNNYGESSVTLERAYSVKPDNKPSLVADENTRALVEKYHRV